MGEGFDVGQVCLRGHPITGYASHMPDFQKKHCPKCGAATVMAASRMAQMRCFRSEHRVNIVADVNSAMLLKEWERQFLADPTKADRTLLAKARASFEREAENEISGDAARLAVRVNYELGDLAATVDLLRRFLGQQPKAEDEFWARWELTDHLAMLRRCNEAVTVQRGSLEWARQRFQPERLLRVMSDGTQALCWGEVGAAEEWLEHFEAILTAVVPDESSRLERFYYIRSAARLLQRMGRYDQALGLCERIHLLASEDRRWKDSWWIKIESEITRIAVLAAMQSPELTGAALRAADLIRANDSAAAAEERAPRLRSLYHNLAAALYFAHQYVTAIPLFERAIALGIRGPHSYAWLAGSLCATGTTRDSVLDLVEAAAVRSQGATIDDVISATPELRSGPSVMHSESAAAIRSSTSAIH